MSYIIKGILNRQLPWGLVLLGVMISLVLEMSGIPSLAFAVGEVFHLGESVDQGAEQMVYAEATIALPLIAGYAYHKGSWKNREARNYAKLLDEPATKTGLAEKRELAGAR